MANDEGTVPEAFRVNQATLDYLKLHIESEVRDRLVKWIGLPFGGAGMLAVVLGVFWYLPDKMATIIQTNPRVEETIRNTASDFLQPDKRGGKFIANHAAAAVNEYLGGDEGRAQLTKQIGDQVGRYLGDEQRAQRLIAEFFSSDQGKSAIAVAVVEKLRSPEVKQLVQDSIDKALAPAVGALMNDLRSKAEQTIISTGALAMEHDTVSKGGYSKLEEFIHDEREKPPAEARPLIMTLTAGGPVHYNAGACATYCRELGDAFPGRFLGTLVTDGTGQFAGLLPPNAFGDPNVPAAAHELIDRLNQADLTQVPALLEKLCGGATACVSETATLAKTLRAPLWKRLAATEQAVAVLGDDRRFRGVTSRQRLIAAVVDAGG